MEKTFTVSARKYRPQKFSEVVGQESVTTTLRNAIRSGKLAHAYLFSGPRGVGKTTCARIFAKTINCEHPTPEGEACNECESCRAFNEGRSFNIHELDAASNNSVEDIRNLIDQVRIPPQIGKYSVYIIDEVHMLSQAAFNAFLKTLEEPPAHAIFIMATTEKHKILPTILSRCQVFDFQRIKVPQIVSHLKAIAEKEGIEAEDDALSIIAQKADGALRDALSIFDQLVSFTGGKLTYQSVIDHLNVLDYDYYFSLTENFLQGDYQQVLLTFDQILQKGFDAQHFLQGLAEHFRNLLVSRTQKTLQLLEVGENIKQRYLEQIKKTPIKFILKALDIINHFDVNYKTSQNKRLHVELALIKLSDITQQIAQQENASKNSSTSSSAKAASSATTDNKNISLSQRLAQKNHQAADTHTSVKTTMPSIKNIIKHSSSQTTSTSNKPVTEDSNASTAVAEKQPPEKKESNPQNPAIKKDIDKTLLLRYWREFADLYLKERPRLQLLFKKISPEVAGDKIIIHLMNEIQKKEIAKLKSQLKQFLYKKCGRTLEIDLIVSAKKVERRPITEKEKYEYLAKKNPALEEFRKKLNLEL